MDRTPLSELVKLVERTIRSEHLRSPNRPIYLVGESFGGCLALAVAASNPDIDLALILVNPATSFSRSQLLPLIPVLDIIPDQLPFNLSSMLNLMTGDPLMSVMDSVVKGLPFEQTIGELSKDLFAISYYLSVLSEFSPRDTLRWKLQMLKSASALSNSRLHAVKAQTMIISSGKDQLLPSEEEAERLYQVLPNCEIRKFNDSGHFLILEDGIDLVTIMKGAGFYRRGKHINYVTDFMPPTPTEFEKVKDENKWINIITSPVMLSTLEDGKIVRGLAGIPSEGPVLLVGYHMLLGLELVPLVTTILSERNILVRGIAHPMMFQTNKDKSVPYFPMYDTFRLMGAVPVSASNFYKLMSSRSHVLLYPGGMREALHRKGEEYQLFWPEQSEFVRVAARFGAKIIPFGAVGEDDLGQVVLDYDDLMKIPYFRREIERLTEGAVKLRTDANGEVGNQQVHLPGILPKFPGRFYYYFGKPIETEEASNLAMSAMAATGDPLFYVKSSSVFHRDLTWPSVGKSKTKQISVSNSPQRLSMSTKRCPTTSATETRRESTFSGYGRLEKHQKARAVMATRSEDPSAERGKLKDFFEQSKELVSRCDGGPPRWFTPLECGSPLPNSPSLLFLPGMIEVGLGLIRQHRRLGKIFEVWCLHIPITDRTPFIELVKLVERTIRSEHHRSPNRPIYLVGECFGGCLALAVAASNPDIDLVPILANPATSFGRSQLLPLIPLLDIIPDQLPLSLPDILSLMTGDPLRLMIDRVVKGLLFQQASEELSQDLVAISSYLSVLAELLPKETLRWKLQMLKSASALSNSRLHAVKADILIISSGKDQLLPSEEEAERLNQTLPKCEIRKFNDSGHFLFLEDDIDLVTIIKGAGFYRRGKYINYVSDFLPPTPTEFQKIFDENKWFNDITSPVMLSTLEDGKIVRGLAGIPSEGPVLLVGYHTLLGLEAFPLVTIIFSQKNILVRTLAHPMILQRNKDKVLPELAIFDTFRIMGAVPVSASNFYRLMSSKSHVLLYPGGVREALHRKGEEYQLFWPEQSEFVRMAARFGAKIIPFGTVGEDDIGQLIVDYDDLMKIPYFKGEIEKATNKSVKLRTDANGEVVNQQIHFPGILPKFPGRFYYYFGKPIETEGRMQELRDKNKSQELYLQVKHEVARCIAYLKEKRESDPYRNLLSRLIYDVTHEFTPEVPTFEL